VVGLRRRREKIKKLYTFSVAANKKREFPIHRHSPCAVSTKWIKKKSEKVEKENNKTHQRWKNKRREQHHHIRVCHILANKPTTYIFIRYITHVWVCVSEIINVFVLNTHWSEWKIIFQLSSGCGSFGSYTSKLSVWSWYFRCRLPKSSKHHFHFKIWFHFCRKYFFPLLQQKS
jgi:hypothetical protein